MYYIYRRRNDLSRNYIGVGRSKNRNKNSYGNMELLHLLRNTSRELDGCITWAFKTSMVIISRLVLVFSSK